MEIFRRNERDDKSTHMKQRLEGVYGDLSLSYTTVKQWAKYFRLGKKVLEVDQCPRRLIEMMNPQNISIIEKIIKATTICT